MLRIGPAGWAYKDWKGIVYPADGTRGIDRLEFIASYFDTVEINTSFYGPMTTSTTSSWVEKVRGNGRFRFTAKLWRGFTHVRSATQKDEALVRSGFDVLMADNLLGAVLLQFPSSFHSTPENRAYLQELGRRFREYPLVLEVRHNSWNEEGTLDFLQSRGIGLCNIDQPLFRQSIEPSAIVTAPVGYIRLHGRNYRSWWTENKHAGERYNYLYSAEELDPWVDRIQDVEQRASDTYVVTNNHYLGKAVVNALEIASVISGRSVEAPAQLVEHYPELKPYVKAQPEQLLLDS